MNNQGDKGVNVMQLIMELEGKVRALTDERDMAIRKYCGAITYNNPGFWWGYGIGTVSMFIAGSVVQWLMK